MQRNNTAKDYITSNLAYDSDCKNGLVSTCTQTNFNSYSHLHIPTSKKIQVVKELCTQTSNTYLPIGSSSNLNYISRNSVINDRLCTGDFVEEKAKEPQGHQALIGEGDIDIEDETLMSPKALALIPFDRSFNVVNFFNQGQRQCRDHKQLLSGTVLTQTYLEKNRNRFKRNTQHISLVNDNVVEHAPVNRLKSQSYIEKSSLFGDANKQSETKFDSEEKLEENPKPLKYFYLKVNEVTQTDKKARSFSFMSPTIASERKNQSLEIKSIERLISPSRRARSISPKCHRQISRTRECSCSNVPYTDKTETPATVHKAHHKKYQILNHNGRNSYNDLESKGECSSSSTSETALYHALCKLRDGDWNTALRGLADIIELCKVLDSDVIHPHMTVINQRLIELIKSPRSHVSRSSCQAVGHLFEYVKDTRRPEFCELVDTLLCKCADSNKFIRHDANLALDCMVTHIPTFHAVRALCAKGPEHKNPLVRTAAARLLVCATVLAGPQNILHPQSNEYTRRRIVLTMVGFLEDRHSDVRKYGERMYKMLSKDRIFDLYLNRYLERDVIHKMRKIIKVG